MGLPGGRFPGRFPVGLPPGLAGVAVACCAAAGSAAAIANQITRNAHVRRARAIIVTLLKTKRRPLTQVYSSHFWELHLTMRLLKLYGPAPACVCGSRAGDKHHCPLRGDHFFDVFGRLALAFDLGFLEAS